MLDYASCWRTDKKVIDPRRDGNYLAVLAFFHRSFSPSDVQMQTAEVKVSQEDLAACLAEMRAWLDSQRFEPSTFAYFHDRDQAGLILKVAFQITDEAQAFALKFGGSLRSGCSASLPVVLRTADPRRKWETD